MSRFDYVRYDGVSETKQKKIKEAAECLEKEIDTLENGRAKSLAMTALEECYMWTGKAIRDQQIQNFRGSVPQEERKNG